jgi:hypothetical protein
MRKLPIAIVLLMLAGSASVLAAPKRHMIVLGKPASVKLFLGADESKPLEIKVRPLYVDGKLKEFTTGEAHDITEQQFTVQRAYRVNDSLPSDDHILPKWRWQRGGWLLVDRSTGRVSPLRFPEFDPFHSQTAWYRDYAAYCGLTDAGDKLYAIVAQVGVRKPLIRNFLHAVTGAETEPDCAPPVWQRQPLRVIFGLKDGQKVTFTVRGRVFDLAPAEPPATAEEESK